MPLGFKVAPIAVGLFQPKPSRGHEMHIIVRDNKEKCDSVNSCRSATLRALPPPFGSVRRCARRIAQTKSNTFAKPTVSPPLLIPTGRALVTGPRRFVGSNTGPCVGYGTRKGSCCSHHPPYLSPLPPTSTLTQRPGLTHSRIVAD